MERRSGSSSRNQASKATLLLYDGSPTHPDHNVLFDFADSTDMTLFGTSAKFIDAVSKAGLAPIETHKLSSMRTMKVPPVCLA